MPDVTRTIRVTTRRQLTASETLRVGRFVLNQIKDRFRTHGASGGMPWKAKRFDDGRGILTGHSATLAKSWGYRQIFGNMKIVLESAVDYAAVHQLGTVKYGGPIPTIKPVQAKALFIPITDKARRSGLFAVGYRNVRMLRMGIKFNKSRQKEYTVPLKRGRWHDGRLEVENPDFDEYEGGAVTAKKVRLRKRKGEDDFAFGERQRDAERNAASEALEASTERRKKRSSADNPRWIPGTPDFIFLMKVDIPPRPMIPESDAEKKALQAFVTKTSGTQTGRVIYTN